MYKIWFARNYRTRVANTLLLDNALATMGAGLPSAMMASMLYPERRVLAVCGDGGFMMNSQEMETAVRLGLNLVVLIVQDNAYGMIRWKQAVDKFPDWGLTFSNPDFVKYAESYGAKGSRVETADGLVPALEAAFKGGGVHLVSVPMDYSENTRVLVDELRKQRADRPPKRGRTMLQIVQAYDRRRSPKCETDGADALEAKLELAAPHLSRSRPVAEAARAHRGAVSACVPHGATARTVQPADRSGRRQATCGRDRRDDPRDRGVRNAAEELRNFAGREIPMGLTAASAGRWAFTTKEPIGVVAAISAFNHPLNLIVHQVAPAIAAGCPVIVKPAAATPLCCMEFVRLVREAGLAEPWCQTFLPSDNALAERLATDPRVAFLSFIGSARVGWYLHSKLAPGTRCALEHGGAAPAIVDRSADLDQVIEPMVKGGYYHAGQVCVSTQRIFVHADIQAEFVERFAARVGALRVGDPLSLETEVGPLIHPREADRVAILD